MDRADLLLLVSQTVVSSLAIRLRERVLQSPSRRVAACGIGRGGGRVILDRPATDCVSVKSVVYREGLSLDLYRPAGSPSARPPVVVFGLGVPDEVALRRHGFKLKDHAQYVAWGRLCAVSGMAAITHETHEPDRDLRDLARFVRIEAESLGVDASRLALWSCSANVRTSLPFALSAAPGLLRCAVFYYGFMDRGDGIRADLPMLVVKAGRDAIPGLNDTIDAFVSRARNLARTSGVELPLEFVDYPNGEHGFELTDESDEARSIVDRTVTFMREQLGVE